MSKTVSGPSDERRVAGTTRADDDADRSRRRAVIRYYHRPRGSGSAVVTMTSKVNGKTEILTPV